MRVHFTTATTTVVTLFVCLLPLQDPQKQTIFWVLCEGSQMRAKIRTIQFSLSRFLFTHTRPFQDNYTLVRKIESYQDQTTYKL